MPKIIGIVEDDTDQLENYADAMRRKGYEPVGYTRADQALEAFTKNPPDLAVLDISLGAEVDGGFELCRSLLAAHPGLPVIFLTDRVDEIDKISGLRLGAWDYETKPISLNFLAEKVAAIFRIMESRSQPHGKAEGIIKTGDLALDENRMTVTWKGAPLDLTLTEFRIVAALCRRPGDVKSYESLMDSAIQTVVAHNTVNTHIRHIRKKFAALDPGFDKIQNEYALGYRWAED
ncbi:MAG: response regulator [Nitrospinota bacterium]|nr:response regulator [Nitrospinota bacterium]MDH5755140.1 response regulator [Nitrospinota bacterium]